MEVLFHFPLIGSFSVFLSESPTSLYFCISVWFEYYNKATVGASLPGM